MTRTFTTVLLLTATALALAADAPKAEPPFKHPRAVQAWKRWQYRSDQLRQQYERALAEERRAYLDGLEEAAKAAAQTGALDEVRAIAEAQDRAKLPSDPAYPVKGQKWVRISSTGEIIVFDIGDGTMEGEGSKHRVWTMDGNTLVVNGSIQFQPTSLFAFTTSDHRQTHVLVPLPQFKPAGQ